MGERLIPAVLKTVVPERVPGVRIPLPPPLSRHYLTAKSNRFQFAIVAADSGYCRLKAHWRNNAAALTSESTQVFSNRPDRQCASDRGMNESTELFMAQRDHGIDAHGTAGWHVTGCHRNAEPKRGNLEIPVIGLAKSGWSLQ